MNDRPKSIRKVFLSSTYEDLIPYRNAANDVFMRLGIIVKSMEFFGSKPSNPKEACLDILRECDAYVGIFAMRYGSIIPGTDKSATHFEYDEAQDLKLPCYIYLIDEKKQPVLPKYIDFEEPAEKLRKLKASLMERHTVNFFTTEDNLSRKIAEDFRDATKTIEVEKFKKEKTQVIPGVINPFVFKLMGKKKLYMMYKLRNYYRHRTDLRKAKFGCYGLFGIADLYVKDLCSDVEDSKLKYSHLFPDLDEVPGRDYLSTPDYFTVDNFIKYKGYAIDSNKNLANYPLDYKFIDEHRKEIRDLANDWDNEIIPMAVKDKLLEKRVMLGPEKILKQKDSTQVWILGIFLPRESGEGLQSCERFEKYVVNTLLLNDDRIRTIVRTGHVRGSLNLHYIIEMEISANDIWDDIVLKIHEVCEENSIIINTKTSMVADPLSELIYDSLLEPQLATYQLINQRELIETIKRGMTQYDIENLNLIPILKQSKPERQEKISQFNKDIAELIEGYSRFSRSKSDQANFLAGMILAQDKSSSNIDVLYRLSYLYLRIASIIENELRILLQTKIKERLQESTNESDNFHDVLKSIDLKAENLDTISFGDCIHGIIKWNGKYSNNLIISLEFNESLKELQRHNADNIRNMFVHGDFSKKKFAKPEMVEEGLRALLSFIKTNNTLFRENQ